MKLKILLFILFSNLFAKAQSLPTITLKSIQGSDIILNANSNKKILVVTIPFAKDDNYDQLIVFCNKYGNKVQVYGVPSIELGSGNFDIELIKSIYTNINIIITEPIYTHKTSGNQQHVLFQWLTDKNKNRHYDVDVTGIGQKFFLSETKKLYAVLAANSGFSIPIIEKIVNASFQ